MANFDWDNFESDSDDIVIIEATIKDIRNGLISPLAQSITLKLDEVIDEQKNLIIALAKIITGKDDENSAKEVNLTNMFINSLAKVITGKDTPDDGKVDKNLVDSLAKVITGKVVEELVLDKTGGETGEYNDTLNDRLKKNLELILGAISNIYTEDEFKEKMQSIKFDSKSSIEENLGNISEGLSYFKLILDRESNFSDGEKHNNANPLVEIERAIKGIV